MSQRYLLDTNIISDLIRNPQGEVMKKIRELGEESICTSIIVASEKGSEKLTHRVEVILSAMEVIAFEEPADCHYAAIRNFLEKMGMTIGPNDMLIAAQALSLNLVIVTANTKEFTRVPELKVENWV